MRGSTRFYLVSTGVLALLLSVLLFQTLDRQGHVERLDVIDAGFYKMRLTGKSYDAPKAAAGVWHAAADLELLKETPAKSAVVGTAFGVRFRSEGQPASAKLRSVWKIPSPGTLNPKSGKTSREDISEFNIKIGADSFRGYSFDEPWEAVPGEWTLQIWQGDRMLLEQSFMIK